MFASETSFVAINSAGETAFRVEFGQRWQHCFGTGSTTGPRGHPGIRGMKQVIPKGVGDGTGIVLCPHCKARLTPRADLCGRKITCPQCREALILPEAPAPKAALPQSSAVAKVESPAKLIAVVCRLCGTRMHADTQQVGQSLRCPDCHVETVVPPPTAAVPRAKRTVHQPYGIVDDAPPVPPTPTPPSTGTQPRQSEKPTGAVAADLIFVACPLCATRMNFAAKHAGRRAQCPDCGTKVVVPQPAAQKPQRTIELEQGQYTVGQVTVEKRAASLPAPKQWTERDETESSKPKPVKSRAKKSPRSFFSGVFLFPWRRDVVLYWVYFSAGILAVGLLITLIQSLLGSGNPMGGFAMAFPAMACLWIGLFTGTFGGACSWSILRDTAAGADDVEEWPSANWQVWIYPLLYLVFIASIAAAFGYAVQWMANTPPGLAQAITALLLTPLLLLSTLETGHPLSIFSAPVLGSLLRSWRSWMLYYVLHLALLITTAAILLGLTSGGPSVFAAILAGPLIAAVWFISARLLGRLAYRLESDARRQNRTQEVRE